MKDSKTEKIFNYSIGCVGVIGVLVTILTLVVAMTQPTQVIAIINQVAGITSTPVMIVVTQISSFQPLPEILPTYTPYPTYTPPPTSTTPIAEAQVFNKQGFLIELIECRGEGRITCLLKITNSEDQDRNVFMGNGRLIDNLGNESLASNHALGNQSWGSGNLYCYSLISNAPTNAQINFSGVSEESISITVLRFNFGYCNDPAYETIESNPGIGVEFRNILIKK